MSLSKHERHLKTVCDLIPSGRDPSDNWTDFLQSCRADFDTGFWNRVRSIEVASDVLRLGDWISQVFSDEPPPNDINGLWFGLFNPCDAQGQATSRLYVAGSCRFDVNDRDWACNPDYWPDARYADSRVLDEIYRLSYDDNQPGAEGEYLCLWYSMLVVAHHCGRHPDLLLGGAGQRGIGVGFDSGDNFFLGMLTAAGFEPQPFVAPQLTRLTTTPTESEFYVLEDCCEGKWWLEWLLGANAEELPAGIAAQGQTIELATPLKIRVDEELGGEPANLMFTVMNELVADVGTADLIERLAPGVVQRLPVTVFGHAGPFEVVNILSIKSRDDSALSNCVRSQSRRGLSSDRVLGETVPPDYRIFRLAENRRRIVVHRLVKEGLEQAGLSGVGLTPLTATS